MNACNAEPTCVGYAHSTAWCVVYGPEIHETPGDKWTSDEHTETTIVSTKPNIAYVCGKKIELEPATDGNDVNGVRRLDGCPSLILAAIASFLSVWN
jgi:hypothetical protein